MAIVFIVYTMFGESLSNSFKQATGGNNLTAVSPSLNQNAQDNTGVTKEDIVLGSGEIISVGQVVAVNYVLQLADGALIQDSKLVNNGTPFNFVYGAGQLIPGWELGIKDMRVGGKRIITIPPELGYGPNAVGPIPANSTLIFEIEVVSAQLLTQ